MVTGILGKNGSIPAFLIKTDILVNMTDIVCSTHQSPHVVTAALLKNTL